MNFVALSKGRLESLGVLATTRAGSVPWLAA
jgi:hypothetical protein